MTTDAMVPVSRESSSYARAIDDLPEHAGPGATPSEPALDTWETDGGRILISRGDDPRAGRSG